MALRLTKNFWTRYIFLVGSRIREITQHYVIYQCLSSTFFSPPFTPQYEPTIFTLRYPCCSSSQPYAPRTPTPTSEAQHMQRPRSSSAKALSKQSSRQSSTYWEIHKTQT